MTGLPRKVAEFAAGQGRAAALVDKAAGRRSPCPYDLDSESLTRRRMGRAWMDAYLTVLPIPDYREV